MKKGLVFELQSQNVGLNIGLKPALQLLSFYSFIAGLSDIQHR